MLPIADLYLCACIQGSMTDDIRLATTKEQLVLSVREVVKVPDIPSTMGCMFGEVLAYMQRSSIQPIGPPIAYYHSWSNDRTDLECGFPVAAAKTDGRIRALTLPAVRAVEAMHVGPYQALMETYTKMDGFMRAHGYEPASYMWEVYLNDPREVPPERLMTEIYWPIK